MFILYHPFNSTLVLIQMRPNIWTFFNTDGSIHDAILDEGSLHELAQYVKKGYALDWRSIRLPRTTDELYMEIMSS